MNQDQLLSAAYWVPIIVSMVLETLAPRRRAVRSTARRWGHTAGLWLIDIVVGRLLLVGSSLLAAAEAAEQSWGLLHRVPLSGSVALLLGIALLDLTGYFKHRLFHGVPMLWRLHAVHHSDTEVDVITGLRHHPADVLLDSVLTAALVAVIGPPVAAVLAYQVASSVHNAYRHANLAWPAGLDRLLRQAIITPDLHRIHHSALERETNSNFGVLFPWWDHLFGSYRAHPETAHESMILGLEYFRDPAEDTLPAMLTQPWRQRRAQRQALADSASGAVTPSA